MTLAELLENQFRADIRFRGAAYIEAERVELTRVTADHIFCCLSVMVSNIRRNYHVMRAT